MTSAMIVGISVVSGLHGALYGAYKDSPHESFLPRRFVRELVFATGAGLALLMFPATHAQSPFVIYTSVFAISRIVTEFWKLFLRVEPQQDFRIPTQIHCVRGVVHNPVLRLALGCGFLASIYGMYCLFRLLPVSLPGPVVGMVVGFGIGVTEAIAGGYKDGTIEGFSWRKFAKSPTFGTLGGLIASAHTAALPFLLLAAIGTMRMFLELLFKMMVQGYAPGKFRSMAGPYQEWMTRRSVFVVPYALTWVFYAVLFAAPLAARGAQMFAAR
jgi:hypothetical protein